MSLVLRAPQPVSIRGLLLFTALLTSTLGIAPTLAQTASNAAHKTVCTCAHCPGGARCCCHGKHLCPNP
jgi:hypothetical protein